MSKRFGKVLLLVACLAPAPRAWAESLAGLPGVEVIDAAVVLADHTLETLDGSLLFRQADGAWVRLITCPNDPEIRNPGEGTFFPVSAEEVEVAIRALSPELLADVNVTVFLLPFPRSGMLGSSADGRGIYLTPGVRTYTPAEIHFLVAHEFGHAFHRHHMPYGDVAWDRYRELRGLEDRARFAFDGPHADRPQEIFAEDFRVLFGSAMARGDGSIENPGIPRPSEVPHLADFFLSFLRDQAPTVPVDLALVPVPQLRVFPNPALQGGQISLRLPHSTRMVSVSVFDVSGREVQTGSPESLGGEWAVALDRNLGPGAYWLRVDFADLPPRTVPIRISR